MSTLRIKAALESYRVLVELERDYVLDELKLVSKSMQLRALEGMSNYEGQALALSKLFDDEHKKVLGLTERIRVAEHELLEARRMIEVLTARLGTTDSEGGAVAEVIYDANAAQPESAIDDQVTVAQADAMQATDEAKQAAADAAVVADAEHLRKDVATQSPDAQLQGEQADAGVDVAPQAPAEPEAAVEPLVDDDDGLSQFDPTQADVEPVVPAVEDAPASAEDFAGDFGEDEPADDDEDDEVEPDLHEPEIPEAELDMDTGP